MLKLAVIGAQTLVGRELVSALEACEASVVPLSIGALTVDEEVGDLVVFAPSQLLLEGLDAVILVGTPDFALLEGFPGRILDLRAEPEARIDPMPLAGAWPQGTKSLRGRPALEQVLALIPSLLDGVGEVGGTHLRSVAWLGDKGLDGLVEQTLAVLNGEHEDARGPADRQWAANAAAPYMHARLSQVNATTDNKHTISTEEAAALTKDIVGSMLGN